MISWVLIASTFFWILPNGSMAQTSDSVAAEGALAQTWRLVGQNLDAPSGIERWRFSTVNMVRSPPTVANGVVYIESSEDGYSGVGSSLHAIEVASGNELWRFTPEDQATISLPTVGDGVVYVEAHARDSWDDSLYALDAANGSERWHVTLEDVVFFEPTVVDGVVYVGSDGSEGGNLHALDGASGRERWHFMMEGGVFFPPTVAEGIVYVESDDGNFYAVEAPGSGLISIRQAEQDT